MNSSEAIKNNIQTADMVCGAYLADLTDEDFMRRPHPECNHINWQVGHLIASDNEMTNSCIEGSLPPLPEGFAEKYSRETKDNNDPSAFCSREELLAINASQRAAILDVLDKLSDEDFAKASPEKMQGYAPTVGAAFNMLGSHWMMHCGQWVIVRRETGKPVVI